LLSCDPAGRWQQLWVTETLNYIHLDGVARQSGCDRVGAYARLVPVSVETATEVTDELVDAFARLIPQLSLSSPVPDAAVLGEIIHSPATHLLVARGDGGEVLGSLTLVLFRIPTGLRAWIEDVVVDREARGKGVGEALNRHAIDVAAERGARSVDLTSRPSREAANRLYHRLGFEPRDTNVYRFTGRS